MSKAEDRTNRKQREGEKDNGVREEFGYGNVISITHARTKDYL